MADGVEAEELGIAAGTASSSRGKIDGEMLVRSVVAVNTADE
jgi:hypothetical protein